MAAKKTATTAAPAPALAPVAAPAPAPSTEAPEQSAAAPAASRKRKAPAASPPSPGAEATGDAPASAAVAAPPTTAVEIVALINSAIEGIRAQVAVARTRKERETVSALTHSMRQLGAVRKPIERLEKANTKRRRTSAGTEPGEKRKTGFMKDQPISSELCAFLGISAGELRSRVDVTQGICKYIKEQGLQNPTNKREILVDERLSELLHHDPSTPLTYYTLQQRIQRHFIKPAPVAA